MKKEIENENKYIVSEAEFIQASRNCERNYLFHSHLVQANYYYDTKQNDLNKQNVTVRVRQIEDKMVMQVKEHLADGQSFIRSNEYSSEIKNLPYVIRIPKVENELYLKGVLITERLSYKIGTNSVISFDRSMYLGTCDYEIEIEFDEEDVNIVGHIIESLQLKYDSCKSKSARFFERIEE